METQIGLKGDTSARERKARWWREETNLEILRDFTDETLEGKLPDQKISRLLVFADFTESDGSGAETMGLLHTTSGGLDEIKQEMSELVR